MAKSFTVHTIDDLTGEILGDDAKNIEFVWIDGKKRQLDLSPENHQALIDLMAPYVNAAQVATGKAAKKPITTRTRAKTGTTEIRAWARQHGYTVSDRGRIPEEIMDAYEAAA